jgi:hypothetical protein
MHKQSPISQRRWGFVLWALILVISAKREIPVFLLPLDGERKGRGDNSPEFQEGKATGPGYFI